MKDIFVAKLGKTVGLKGLLKLHIDSDFPDQFKKNAKFLTNKNKELIIESFNINNNTVKFLGINTIDDAQKYINSELYTSLEDTKNTCNLEKNQYFWFDLISCNIIESNELLGKIKDIHRYPVDDYFEIQTNNKLLNDDFKVKTFLLPYNKTYIKNVDLNNKIIEVSGAKDILLNS